MGLRYDPRTLEYLTATQGSLPQSILLSGEAGVGLTSLARHIGELHEAVIHEVAPLATIKVEVIRELYEQVRSKQNRKQLVIIDDAHTMTETAQNAFLKLLEEPQPHIFFVLTSHLPDRLLPTIRSRVQHHTVTPLDRDTSSEIIREFGVTDATKMQQLLYVASGRPAELYRLIHDEAYFTRVSTHVRDARELLQAQPYEKLLIAQKYKDDRAGAIELLRVASTLARRSLSEKPAKKTINELAKLTDAIAALQANGNVRLLLAELVV